MSQNVYVIKYNDLTVLIYSHIGVIVWVDQSSTDFGRLRKIYLVVETSIQGVDRLQRHKYIKMCSETLTNSIL